MEVEKIEQLAHELRTRTDSVGIVLMVVSAQDCKVGVSLDPNINVTNLMNAIRSVTDGLEASLLKAQAEKEGG